MNPTKLTCTALLTGIPFLSGVSTFATSLEETRPNIILIMTDQQTAGALSCMGNPDVKTPAMDALAADGVMLTRAYCSFPVSNPSRASLMTGYMAYETGVRDNGDSMTPEYEQRSLGLVMKDAGYECLYAGKWHIPDNEVPDRFGFTNITGMDDRILVDKCKPYLQKKYERPLFFVASFLNPHEICEYARNESLPYGQITPFDLEKSPNLPANFMPSTYEPEALKLEKQWAPLFHDTYTYSQDDWRRYLYAYYRTRALLR